MTDRDHHARPDGLSGIGGTSVGGLVFNFFGGKIANGAAAISLRGSRETFAMVDGRIVDGNAGGRS